MSNAAILYLRDGFETSREDLMGRHAAGEGMLRGMARWLGAKECFAFVPDQASFDAFVGKMRSFGLPETTRCTRIGFDDDLGLRKAGCLFLPQPKIDLHAWQRRWSDQRGYSLCGVTHTTSSHQAMDAIGALLTAPVQPWDAVICTSKSVRATFERILGEYGAYLQARLGASGAAPRPMLPIIPLGIHCDQFAPPDSAAQRAHWRERLGIGPDELAVLFVGRLSFHAKAHPFPMLRALELASRSVPQRIHLIQSGWFHNQGIEQAFREGAARLAPGVTHHFVDGRKPDARFGIWHAADVFCSLSDNIQETFGLTPVEAMAAGLPVVASDWDGYRETVEHGGQGFLVPTYAPAPGFLEELAYRHAAGTMSYDHYLFQTCTAVAVDIEAAARAFERLFTIPDLRREMGAAGRRRARGLYDWKVVIGRYAELWREMAEVRSAAEESSPRLPGRPADPMRDDPFALFEGYPTHRVGEGSRIVPVRQDLPGDVSRLRALVMNQTLRLPDEAVLARLLARLRHGPTLSELLADLPPEARGRAAHTVLWLKKMGLVGIEQAPAGSQRPD